MRRLAGALLLVAALAAPPAAHAGFTATFDPGSGVLTVSGTGGDDTLTMARDSAGDITLTDENGPVPISGGTPTVDNTDTIDVNSGLGGDEVNIDTAGGRFIPGKTTESGGLSELEIVIAFGEGNDRLVYRGTGGQEFVDAGELSDGVVGLNVTSDPDVDDVRSDGETLQIDLMGGPDLASAAGLSPFAGPFRGNLIVNGGTGVDIIDAGAGTNTLNGGADRDHFVIFAGANLVDGGAGANFASVRFAGALTVGQSGASATVDAPGLTGELASMERVTLNGSQGDDLVANGPGLTVPLEVFLYGGQDSFSGGAGGDFLDAGPGNDKANGGSGDDILSGDTGDDELDGGEGHDDLDGGEGTDFCANGEVLRACELPAALPGGPPPAGAVDLEAELERVLGSWTRAARRGGIGAAVARGGFSFVLDHQAGTYGFQVTAQQSPGASARRRLVIARTTRRFDEAGTTRVRVKLTRKGRRALRGARRLRIALRIRHTSTAGDALSASRRVTLRRRRR